MNTGSKIFFLLLIAAIVFGSVSMIASSKQSDEPKSTEVISQESSSAGKAESIAQPPKRQDKANDEDLAKADEAFWKSVYSENKILGVEISVTQQAWNEMAPKQGGGLFGFFGPPRGGEGGEYTYVKSQIVIDGEPFKDCGLRFKGNSSYRSSSRSFKRPMKIDTNRFDKGQKLHGRTKLNFSNAFLDSAYMKEKLAYDLYRAAGLPTPAVGWADVTLLIDGKKRPLGVYVLVEQVDKRFLKENFGKKSEDSLLMKPEVSWRYLGTDPKAYSAYGVKSGEENVDQILQFAELLKLIEEGSDKEFADEIGERVDLEQLAAYLAVTSMLSSADSYVGMPHNYYLLVDKADDKLKIMPWDVNEAFGTFTLGGSPEAMINWDIDRPWVGQRLILERLFEVEEFVKLYKATYMRLFREHFTKEKMIAKIDSLKNMLGPCLKKTPDGFDGLEMGIEGDADGTNRAVERRVLAIKPFVVRRIEAIASQLNGKSDGVMLRGRRGPR